MQQQQLMLNAPPMGTGSKPLIKAIVSFTEDCRLVHSAHCHYVLFA